MTATRTDTLLSINNVNFSYGEKVILRDVNARIDNLVRTDTKDVTGQVVAFLGPSGIGKTTMLRIIAGLLKPTSGTVLLGVEQKPAVPGDVGVVAQRATLRRNRTVLGNLLTAAKKSPYPNKCGVPNSEVIAYSRSMQILEDFGLPAAAHLYPCQLSGGEKQRVAIAQQILCAGDFLLLDEPTASLDPINKSKVCRMISSVAARNDLETIIICSHDIPSAVAVADTAWLMGRKPGAPGASIVQEFDLIERGLAFQPGIQRTTLFAETVREIGDRFGGLA